MNRGLFAAFHEKNGQNSDYFSGSVRFLYHGKVLLGYKKTYALNAYSREGKRGNMPLCGCHFRRL